MKRYLFTLFERAGVTPQSSRFFVRYGLFMLVANLAWEIAHLPLYTLWADSTIGYLAFVVFHCTAGDLMIAFVALGVAHFAAPVDGERQLLLGELPDGLQAIVERVLHDLVKARQEGLARRPEFGLALPAQKAHPALVDELGAGGHVVCAFPVHQSATTSSPP